MKSPEYWLLRALQREADTFQSTNDTIKRLRVIYDSAAARLSRVAKQIFINFQKSGGVDSDEAKKLLSVQETAEVLAALKKEYTETNNPDLLAKLEAPAYAYRLNRVQVMRKAIDAETTALAEQQERIGENQLLKTYDASYYKTMYDTAQLAEKDITFTPMPQRTITEAVENRWKGENYSERVWKNTHLVAKEAGKIIDEGISSGASVAQMSHDILDLFDVGYYAAARLVRTEVNRMHNDAALKSYKAMGVEEYTFLATLDARTCVHCGALDSKHFKVSEARTGVNLPPLHPNDRCTTAAWYPDNDYSKGTRIARNPETGKNYYVRRDMTYEQWRKEVGTDELEKAKKRYYNIKRDSAEQQNMKKVIGDKVPSKIADFQDLKYNNTDEWKKVLSEYNSLKDLPAEKLHQIRMDEKVQARIRSDEQSKEIIVGRQEKHFLNSNNYKAGNSYLTVSLEDAQKLVDEYAGHGEPLRKKNGAWNQKELIFQYPDKIGIVFDIEGKPVKTNKFIIHYSKDGVHIVPTLREEKKP